MLLKGGVNNLHGVPGVLSGLASGAVAALATRELYDGNALYTFYPARTPVLNSAEFNTFNLTNTDFSQGGDGRTGMQQAGYQIVALAMTLAVSIVGGLVTGFIMRFPIFEQVTDEEELFDDEPNWQTPGDFGFDASDLHKTTAEKKLFLSTSA